MTYEQDQWKARRAVLAKQYKDAGITDEAANSILADVARQLGVTEAVEVVTGATESGDPAVRDLARQYAATMPYGQALQRAESVLRAERGEVTQADIDGMSMAEVTDFIAGGGQLPDNQSDEDRLVAGDWTEEEVAETLAKYDAESHGGVYARQEAQALADKTAEYRSWLVTSLGYTPEQAAKVNMPEVAKQASGVSTQPERDSIHALSRTDLGLPELD